MKSFLRDEEGQDLIEYSLLIAFVALASAALFIGSGQSVKGVWTVANSQLAKGAGGCQNPLADSVFCAD
jgi:Flp pilus assembly pilin Flp